MVEKISKSAEVRQEVQKRYQAELMRYKLQIEKNKEIFEKGKPR
jgi:hypothetical protein